MTWIWLFAAAALVIAAAVLFESVRAFAISVLSLFCLAALWMLTMLILGIAWGFQQIAGARR